MKMVGRVIAIVLAGVLSVFAVQQGIRRLYRGFGGHYITLPPYEEAQN